MQHEPPTRQKAQSIGTILSEARGLFGFKTDYEDQQLNRLPELLRGTKRFIDVGANRGLYSYVANAILTECEIIAVEADPSLSQRLKQAMATWPKHNRNRLVVLECAAGDTEARLPFTIGLEDTLGSFTQSDYRVEGAKVIDVPVRPLDEAVAPAPQTVLKIDIEGFEYRALTGALRHLAQPGCTLILELHAWGDASIGKYPHHVLALLRSHGFHVARFGEAHQFVCRRATGMGAWVGYLKNAPKFHAKYLLRRAGLRDKYYKLTGRAELAALRERSGVRQ